MGSPQRQDRLAELLEEFYQLGVERGYELGYAHGVEDTKNSFKSSVSDGLRHGSSECGKAMNSFKEDANCNL